MNSLIWQSIFYIYNIFLIFLFNSFNKNLNTLTLNLFLSLTEISLNMILLTLFWSLKKKIPTTNQFYLKYGGVKSSKSNNNSKICSS